MLFKTTVTSWVGVGRDRFIKSYTSGTEYVLDINNVSNIQAEGSGCKFLYLSSTVNRKAGYDEIHCTTDAVTVKDEYSVPPLSNALALSIFPNNDITKTPRTVYIDVHDFCYAWAHNPYPQYSWLVYSHKGSKDVRVLVNMTLDDFVDLDTGVAPTNAQWYFFVDPLETIQPTWYIYVEVYSGAYGALYNYYVASDVRNIANTGWHVITGAEWLTLRNTFSPSSNELKETGTLHWTLANGTNTSLFTVRGNGQRTDIGGFSELKSSAYLWWGNFNWVFIIGVSSDSISLIINSKTGAAIRLAKDSTLLLNGQSGTYVGNDSKVYRTICIGGKELLAQNIAETKYRNGDDIPEVTDDAAWAALLTGAMCYYNNVEV